MKSIHVILILLLLAPLSSCNYCEVIKPSQEEIIARSWAKSELAYPKPKPLYCYKTIGDEVCYARPIHDDQENLLGYYGPRP